MILSSSSLRCEDLQGKRISRIHFRVHDLEFRCALESVPVGNQSVPPFRVLPFIEPPSSLLRADGKPVFSSDSFT